MPGLCWNRRRKWAVAALLLQLVAIPIQCVLRFGFFAYIVTSIGMIVAIWIGLAEHARRMDKKPNDCRYGYVCEVAMMLIILEDLAMIQ